MTAKILKIANSAYYGFQRQVSSLAYAIQLLGFNMIKSLALSVGVIRTMPETQGSEYFNSQDLWLHNLAVAGTMEKIGTKVSGLGEDSPLFVIGMLHDIGKILLDQYYHEKFVKALELAHGDVPMALNLAEHKMIGADRDEVAGMLLKRWNFPENIRVPIFLHHKEERLQSPFSKEVSILRIANILARTAGIGSDGNLTVCQIDPFDLEQTGFGEKEVEIFTRELIENKEGVQAFFSGA